MAKKKEESTALVKVEEAHLERIEEVVSSCDLSLMGQKNTMKQAMALSRGIQQLRELITEEILDEVFMPLQGTALGFRSDRVYEKEEIKEPIIEALIRGAYPVGNEFNIIAKRAYLTKEYFIRKQREFPGLTNLKINLGVPKRMEGGAITPCTASWKLDDKEGSIEAEIPCKTDKYTGVDAILGKAERKLRKRIHERITGSIFHDGDADDAKTVDVTVVDKEPKQSKTEALKQLLNGKENNKEEPGGQDNGGIRWDDIKGPLACIVTGDIDRVITPMEEHGFTFEGNNTLAYRGLMNNARGVFSLAKDIVRKDGADGGKGVDVCLVDEAGTVVLP